ncbi:MAG: choice-of-anchor L domain-containing protein [Nannocystaceae bacterium]|nr:choice-of-anchor L domain-containing protein [Nannocystaceae bacterium]
MAIHGSIRVGTVLLAVSACSTGTGRDRFENSTTSITDTLDPSTGSDGGSADSTTTGGGSGCASNGDCVVPGLSVCDTQTGACVGCVEDADCPAGKVPLHCNGDGLCEGCMSDAHCPLGSTCQGGVCAPGCDDDQPCPGNFACCGTCVDLATDEAHCGGCDAPCDTVVHGTASCEDSSCVPSCNVGYGDCDGDASNGCEAQGSCACAPGSMQACYTGEAGTMDIGVCAAGMQACNDAGTAWGPCEGEVTPGDELCGNGLDDNCDGAADENPDADGDGFGACGGDCCDHQGRACANPELVNPGAFEVDGNDVDDDCDGTADNPLPACDAGLMSNSADPLQYAQAIDLCQFTDEVVADPADQIWGVIEGEFTLASGVGLPASMSRAIRDGFGNAIANRLGDRLAVLSTGRAADNADDANPAYAAFQLGQAMGTSSGYPNDWYTANGSSLPNAPGCPAPIDGNAQNPIMLRLRVRVPTNANSFSVDMYFLSAEYPEYVCTEFNDFFVTLVDSSSPANPADKNIAIYDDGMDTWPVGVNILSAANGLFTACTDGTISQCGAPVAYNGCVSNAELAGTGFDAPGAVTYNCDYGGETGGGTGWLTMSGNVTPGEVMEIRFAIWDTSDQVFDSLVLLDDWQWSVQASEPGVTPG